MRPGECIVDRSSTARRAEEHGFEMEDDQRLFSKKTKASQRSISRDLIPQFLSSSSFHRF